MSEYKDNKFIKNVLKYKKIYEEIKNEMNNYELLKIDKNGKINVKNLKNQQKKKYDFYIIGYIDNNIFKYYDENIRKNILSHILDYQFVTKKIISFKFINKYFGKNEIKLKNKEDIKIIIYLLSICNPKYNIIEFITPDKKYHFAFINLGLNSKINYDYEKYYMIADEINLLYNKKN